MSNTHNDQPFEQALLSRILNRIRQSLDLKEILATTVTEIRTYLDTDRVKIYQFMPDGHGWVIAESLNEENLPSLLGLHFPADDIPAYARELYLRDRQRTITNVEQHAIGVVPFAVAESKTPESKTPESKIPESKTTRSKTAAQRISETSDHQTSQEQRVDFRPLDPCHLEYLYAMGVMSSTVIPIILDNQLDSLAVSASTPLLDPDLLPTPSSRLWGLLISHHAQPKVISVQEVNFIQAIVHQVAIAIAQAHLREQVREQSIREASIN
ncbi:MAG: GAF domain-containing protein, partial [Cyanothece sp. SIO2G6]|nr:GAF domain-containing protein [Cyanothece sp. SIO2G6]